MPDEKTLRFTAQQYYDMSDVEFRTMYESPEFSNMLNFLETRIRLEVLTIIRRFRLKGDVLFEIRQKSTASAYSKLQREIIARQQDLGNKKVYLFDILFDLIGVRLICIHDDVQKRLFDYILQVESLAIQPEGLEFYSAPFRDYTLAKDIHEELADSINKLDALNNSNPEKRILEKKSKTSNYESLHFYVKFASKVDEFLLLDLTEGKRRVNESERIRDDAESKYLHNIYDNFTKAEKALVSTIPIEVQIRTITDHLWAHEEHKYVYKNPALSGSSPEQSRTLEVLKSTFTGLKFAYYNVERLRSLVRSITREKEQPILSYTGSSKDFNPIRFKFFRQHDEKAASRFKEVEKIFQENNEDLANEKVYLAIFSLFEHVNELDKSESSNGSSPFDLESWGRKRLFYLFLAYTALFSKTKTLPIHVAEKLNENMELVDLVGNAAFWASVNDKRGCLKLASKIYERVETFDRIARSLIDTKSDLKDFGEMVFSDPLVGIRLASSFFLQSEFAGARKSISDMFKLGAKPDYTSWHEHELASAYSLHEILMRYSQYVFFDSFEDEDKLLENFQELATIFDTIFQVNNEEFCAELYRSYSWYYSLINYLYTQEALVPQQLSAHKVNCRNYLLKHVDTIRDSVTGKKPEVQLALVYLPTHFSSEFSREELAKENHDIFKSSIEQHGSYPRIANVYLSTMAKKLRQRALEKISRAPNTTFLSYSRKNKKLAQHISEALKNQKISVVYDEDFDNGEGISTQVERAMADATTAILLVTPEYLTSDWGAEERAFLMDKRRRKELRLFVLNNGVEQAELAEKAPLLSNLVHYPASKEELNDSLGKVANTIMEDIESK